MVYRFANIQTPGADLTDEELKSLELNLSKMNIVAQSFEKLRTAETSLAPLIDFFDGSRGSRVKFNKERVQTVLAQQPNFIEKVYASLRAYASELDITPNQFNSCVQGVERSLRSGKAPTGRLREVFHTKWLEAHDKVAEVPASFQKTLHGAVTNLAFRPDCLEFLHIFRSHSSLEAHSTVATLTEHLRKTPIYDLPKEPYIEQPQRYAAYALAKELAPAANTDFIAEVEDEVGRDISTWISDWRSFVDNPPSKGKFSGVRQHYFGPNPPTRKVSMLLFYICSNEALRNRFRTQLIELLSIAVSMQEASGAWTDAFQIQEQDWNTSVRDECTLSTAFLTLALSEMLGSVDYTKPISRAVNWLVRAQQPDGSFKDTDPNRDNTACVTLLVCASIRRFAEGAEANIERAHTYLLEAQDECGFWQGDRPISEFQLTALALRYMLSSSHSELPLGAWGQSALQIQSLAEDLLARGDTASIKIAVVSSLHAVEFALYEAIERFPSGSIYKGDTRDQTIGVRQAKANLRDIVRGLGKIEATHDLPHSTQISGHASIRDNVIHKNQSVDDHSAQQAVGTAGKFINLVLSLQP